MGRAAGGGRPKEKPQSEPDFLSAPELARSLGVCAETVDRWVAKGAFPPALNLPRAAPPGLADRPLRDVPGHRRVAVRGVEEVRLDLRPTFETGDERKQKGAAGAFDFPLDYAWAWRNPFEGKGAGRNQRDATPKGSEKCLRLLQPRRDFHCFIRCLQWKRGAAHFGVRRTCKAVRINPDGEAVRMA